MATELVLIDGVWVLRTATSSDASGVSTTAVYGSYDYVAPTVGSSIEFADFVQLSTSGSYS
jgi:hypothetical protein